MTLEGGTNLQPHPEEQRSTLCRHKGKGLSSADWTTAHLAASPNTTASGRLPPFSLFLTVCDLVTEEMGEWKKKKKGKTDKVGVVRWDLVRKKYICKLLWVLRWPSPSLSVTGRSKRMSGTERAASCGLEDGQMWWVASAPGTKTSCRIRPC